MLLVKTKIIKTMTSKLKLSGLNKEIKEIFDPEWLKSRQKRHGNTIGNKIYKWKIHEEIDECGRPIMVIVSIWKNENDYMLPEIKAEREFMLGKLAGNGFEITVEKKKIIDKKIIDPEPSLVPGLSKNF